MTSLAKTHTKQGIAQTDKNNNHPHWTFNKLNYVSWNTNFICLMAPQHNWPWIYLLTQASKQMRKTIKMPTEHITSCHGESCTTPKKHEGIIKTTQNCSRKGSVGIDAQHRCCIIAWVIMFHNQHSFFISYAHMSKNTSPLPNHVLILDSAMFSGVDWK